MSFFRVILAILFGFGSLLIGMEKEEASVTFKYSNPYFDPELQKSLTLIMLKNRNAQEVVALHQDVLKVIAKNSYDLRKKEFWYKDLRDWIPGSQVSTWAICQHIMNNPERRKVFQGEEIDYSDFDFVTMSDEGREIFKKVSYNIPFDKKKYPRSAEDLEALKQSHGSSNLIFTDDTYDAVLKVPLRLRSKVGKLCTVKVIGEQRRKPDQGIRWAAAGIVFGVLGGWCDYDDVLYYDYIPLSHFIIFKVSVLGFWFGGIGFSLDILRDLSYEKRGKTPFNLVEKPLITSEEQKMMKQAEQKEREKQRAKDKEFAKFMSKTENFEQLPQELSNRTQLDLLSLRNRL